jgi:hypothetical protein
MGELVNLQGAQSRWFADERGRSLRATWHPEGGLVILSLWNSDQCVGTFRLSALSAAELGALIDQAREHLNARDQIDSSPGSVLG